MMRLRALILLLALIVSPVAGPVAAGALDHMRPAPPGWKGHVFQPSYHFPRSFQKSGFPWLAISFRHEPERYLQALLDYALKGQDLSHFDLSRNRAHHWYHMPWLGIGPYAREYIHGMTRGRDFPAGELSSHQTQCRQNWAIAFYNDVGGAMLREIWGHGQHAPDFRSLPFLLNTVAVKLVYTEADAHDDPLLSGAPELEAAVDSSPARNADDCPSLHDADGRPSARTPTTLRLLQVDLAVREQRASYKTGWVFGSFRYDGTMPGSDPWKKLKPIGLMWGNDPQLTDEMAAGSSKPQQSIVRMRAPDGGALGRGGRMNGVADNRQSACSSCHMAAQWPSVSPMLAPSEWSQAKCWFRNVDGRYPFGFSPDSPEGCGDPVALEKIKPLDFSLQLAIATRNWASFHAKGRHPFRSAIGEVWSGDHGELIVNGLNVRPLK
jgi:hypothetical protein